MLMFASSYAEVAAGSGRSATARWECRVESSEALAKPSSDPCDVAAPCGRVPRSSRFKMLKMCRLRIDQQSRRDVKRRSLRFFGKSPDAERPADPHRAAENARGARRKPVQLACPPRKHQRATRTGRELT